MYGGCPYVQVGKKRRAWSISTVHVPNPDPLGGRQAPGRHEVGRGSPAMHIYIAHDFFVYICKTLPARATVRAVNQRVRSQHLNIVEHLVYVMKPRDS